MKDDVDAVNTTENHIDVDVDAIGENASSEGRGPLP